MKRTPEMLKAGVGLKRPSSMDWISSESKREQRAYYARHFHFWGTPRWASGDLEKQQLEDRLEEQYHREQEEHTFTVDEAFYLVWLAQGGGPVPPCTSQDIAQGILDRTAGNHPAAGQR